MCSWIRYSLLAFKKAASTTHHERIKIMNVYSGNAFNSDASFLIASEPILKLEKRSMS